MTPDTTSRTQRSRSGYQAAEPLPGPFTRLDDDLLLRIVRKLDFGDRYNRGPGYACDSSGYNCASASLLCAPLDAQGTGA